MTGKKENVDLLKRLMADPENIAVLVVESAEGMHIVPFSALHDEKDEQGAVKMCYTLMLRGLRTLGATYPLVAVPDDREEGSVH